MRVEISANPNPERWGEAAINGVPFLPVIDGESLPTLPIDAIAAGAGANIDVLVGTNADEFRLYVVPQGTIKLVNEQMLRAAIAGYGMPVEETLATYRANRKDATPGELLATIITDWFFRIPAIRMAEVHSQQGTGGTYMYEFAWQSPSFDGRLGACHALDVPFIFDNLDKEGYEGLAGPNPPQQLADAMHTAWIAFASSGTPGWPQYNLEQRATMRFDTTSQVVDDPRSEERVLWEGRR
jgi:para-nitrobenzyl esterase